MLPRPLGAPGTPAGHLGAWDGVVVHSQNQPLVQLVVDAHVQEQDQAPLMCAASGSEQQQKLDGKAMDLVTASAQDGCEGAADAGVQRWNRLHRQERDEKDMV